MIDLTPLDVRKKKGDFRRGIRGYESDAVDDFLDLVAERMEELVRENTALRQRVEHLSEAMGTFRERERALNEALVSAQQLREEVRTQAAREAEMAQREARQEADRMLADARREVQAARAALQRVEGQRAQFVRAFRTFVERQLDAVEQEESRLADLSRADVEPTVEPDDGPGADAKAEVEAPTWLSDIEKGGGKE